MRPKMLNETTDDYNKYLRVELDKKLVPIHQSVDDMLTRLEEFETMLAIVQEERCNAVGLTGSLSQAVDSLSELKELCTRVDVLEKLMGHIRCNVDVVEKKVEAAEEEFGLTDNAVKIKNLLMPLFQKKAAPVRESTVDPEVEIFSTETYFSKDPSA